MRLRYIVWSAILLLLVVAGIQPGVQTTAVQTVTGVQNKLTRLLPAPSPKYTLSDSQAADTGAATVSNTHLKRVYHYHFAANTPTEIRRLFLTAVKNYNRTGIVKLVPGTATKHQNGITFGIYSKANRKSNSNAQQSNTIELGVGGPTIIQHSGRENYTVNHAHAKINMRYQESVTLSVAMHELGHAVGLEHSTNEKSVMYPIDQGVNQLSRSDIKHLKKLYPKK